MENGHMLRLHVINVPLLQATIGLARARRIQFTLNTLYSFPRCH